MRYKRDIAENIDHWDLRDYLKSREFSTEIVLVAWLSTTAMLLYVTEMDGIVNIVTKRRILVLGIIDKDYKINYMNGMLAQCSGDYRSFRLLLLRFGFEK